MRPRFLIVMGVSGSGKTSVGQSLAARLDWEFYDADDFHPQQNIDKMAAGIPLDDSDRAPWLAALHELIEDCLRRDHPGVLACSALKDRYRRELTGGNENEVKIVYLKGSYDLIWSRMNARPGHYMKPGMLRSQFEALEEPAGALAVEIGASVGQITEEIIQTLFREE